MVVFRVKTLMQAKSLSKNFKQITLRVDSSDQIFAWDSPFERCCFFEGKGFQKGIFHERFSVFWYKNGAQQLSYVAFSLNCLILAILRKYLCEKLLYSNCKHLSYS